MAAPTLTRTPLNSFVIELAPGAIKALRRPAAARGITPKQLIARIVETVASDDLIDAVLDDAEE